MYCGPRCLVYIAKQEQRELDLEEASRLAHTNGNGTPPEDMVQALQALGFQAELRQDLCLDELKRLLPEYWVIVDWWSDLDSDGPGDGHYSVILKVTANRVWLYDPDLPTPRKLPRPVFEARWYDYETQADGTRTDLCNAAVLVKRQHPYSV